MGFLAGEMLLTDPAAVTHFGTISERAVTFGGLVGAVVVASLGSYLSKRAQITSSNRLYGR